MQKVWIWVFPCILKQTSLNFLHKQAADGSFCFSVKIKSSTFVLSNVWVEKGWESLSECLIFWTATITCNFPFLFHVFSCPFSFFLFVFLLLFTFSFPFPVHCLFIFSFPILLPFLFCLFIFLFHFLFFSPFSSLSIILFPFSIPIAFSLPFPFSFSLPFSFFFINQNDF